MTLPNKRILVTGIGGPAGKAVASFLSSNNLLFVGVDMNPMIKNDISPVPFYTIPAADSEEFVPCLLDIAKRQKISLIIPTVDEELVPIAKNKELFLASGIKLIMSPLSTIETCRDKYATATFLNREGFLVPRSVLVDDAKQLGFPMLAKPRSGRGGKGITVFKNESELQGSASKFDDSFIFQEFISGQEYDVNLFVHNRSVLVNQVLLKTELEYGNYGNAIKTIPTKNKAIEDIASKVCGAIGAEGPIDIDIRMTSEGSPCILEINPRIGANVLKAEDILRNMLEIAEIR